MKFDNFLHEHNEFLNATEYKPSIKKNQNIKSNSEKELTASEHKKIETNVEKEVNQIFPGEITHYFENQENESIFNEDKDKSKLKKYNLTILEIKTIENNFETHEKILSENLIEKFEVDLNHDYNKNTIKSRYDFK